MMYQELRGHQTTAMGFSDFSPADMGYDAHELYSLQAASLEQQIPSIAYSPQQNLSFHGGKFISSQTVVSGTQKLKHSKYLLPAKELLNEFCDLGGVMRSSKQGLKRGRLEGGDAFSAALLEQYSLKSLNILDLQKRRALLQSMLEEVDKRYKRYCEQMRAVVLSFEAAAGEGTAAVYVVLASKAMSKHFRCLRDAIAGQIRAARKAMGDKGSITAPGMSRGETPRLKLFDQCYRQHKAAQVGCGFADPQPWRPQRGLPERSVSILRAWLFDHFLHPYPSDVDKHVLARQTGLSRNQVTNWFINARVRLWKPMIEEIYLEDKKENEQNAAHPAQQDGRSPNPSLSIYPREQKSPPAELIIDLDSLSSVINVDCQGHTSPKSFHNYQNRVQRTEHFGMANFDFSSYSGCSSRTYGGNGVSLTLGLQHYNAASAGVVGGEIFTLPKVNHQQFAMIDGEVQKLSYKHVMGAQWLHDLAG